MEGKATEVSVAMDNRAGIAYGTPVCIPQLNHKYNKVINFRVCTSELENIYFQIKVHFAKQVYCHSMGYIGVLQR